MKEFEITRILGRSKFLQIVVQSMMTDEQQLLVQMQNCNILSSNEESASNSNEDEAVDIINDP